MLPVEAGAAGAGQPFKRVVHWQLPNADWNELESAIANRNLEMTYVV